LPGCTAGRATRSISISIAKKSGLDDAEAALRAAAALEVDFVRARRGQTGSSLQQSAG
jgi:hypothetical protein